MAGQNTLAPQEPVKPNELGAALRNGRILTLVFIALTIAFVMGYIDRTQASRQIAAEIEQVEALIVAANLRSAELRAELSYVGSDDYLDTIARQELGMAQPNETALVLLNRPAVESAPQPSDNGAASFATDAPAPASRTETPSDAGSPSIWQSWLELLTASTAR